MEIALQAFDKPFPHEIHYPRDSKEALPLICITPLLGRMILFEDLFWERHFARFFAKNGFACLIVDRVIFGYDPQYDIKQISKYLDFSIQKNKAVLDSVLSSEIRIDSKRIASFGISFGSIVNCLWAAADDRLQVNVLALSGGKIPEICVRSQDPLMRSIMDTALKATGLGRHDFQIALSKVMELEPLEAAHVIKSRKNMMILAKWDCVVPADLGRELQSALGNPPTIVLPLGHYLSVLAAPFLKQKVLNFIRDSL